MEQKGDIKKNLKEQELPPLSKASDMILFWYNIWQLYTSHTRVRTAIMVYWDDDDKKENT